MRILTNGTLVTPEGVREGDVALDGNKIARVADHIEPVEGDEVVDVRGCWVFPGFIGGTTTVVDYATADRGVTMPDALAEWHKRADGTCTANYAFHMALAEWN